MSTIRLWISFIHRSGNSKNYASTKKIKTFNIYKPDRQSGICHLGNYYGGTLGVCALDAAPWPREYMCGTQSHERFITWCFLEAYRGLNKQKARPNKSCFKVTKIQLFWMTMETWNRDWYQVKKKKPDFVKQISQVSVRFSHQPYF